MALNASNVRVAVTGGVYVAPSGTALPSDATTALNAAFEDLGFVSDEGITQTIAADTSDIVAWQNASVVRKVQTSHDLSYALTLIETKGDVLAVFYGGDGDEITADVSERQSWVIDVVDGDDTIRIVIPDGQITERGDVVYASGEAIGYPVTITAYEVDGVKAYLYRDTDGS